MNGKILERKVGHSRISHLYALVANFENIYNCQSCFVERDPKRRSNAQGNPWAAKARVLST